MRMWLVPPHLLCRQHLLGEHRELHTMWRSIELKKYGHIHGHTRLNQIDVSKIIERHNELVIEMTRRGYNHQSPLPDYAGDVIQEFIEVFGVVPVDVEYNLRDLAGRCLECRRLQIENRIIV